MEKGAFHLLRKSVETVSSKSTEHRGREAEQLQKMKRKFSWLRWLQKEKKQRPSWGTYDSELLGEYDSFNKAFSEIIPEEYSDIKQYIETEFADMKGQVVGMEMGGPGSKLFSGFNSDLFKESYGFTLVDFRNKEEKKDDSSRHHKIVEGDALSSEGRRRIEDTLQGKKINVFFERMAAGLPFSLEIEYLAASLYRNYKLLDDEALFFAEFCIPKTKESSFSPDEDKKKNIKDFLEHLKLVPGLDVAYGPNLTSLRIRKHKGAPKDLKQYLQSEATAVQHNNAKAKMNELRQELGLHPESGNEFSE